jgi:hypothetical protein
VWPLSQSLGEVRLRPRIAETLAAIDDDAARGPLAAALATERYQTARVAIADALVALGAKEELARPLIRFLGTPDPIPGGVGFAERAKILELIGGPNDKGLAKLRAQSNLGVTVQLTVPRGGSGSAVRALVRARATGRSGEVRIGRPAAALAYSTKDEHATSRKLPTIHERYYVSARVPPSESFVEIAVAVPSSVGARPGRSVDLVVFSETNVEVDAVAVVPLSDELPPPPPEPWVAAEGDSSG